MILDVYVISLVLIVTSTVNLQGHRGNFGCGSSGVSRVREPNQTYQVGLKFRIFFLLE